MRITVDNRTHLFDVPPRLDAGITDRLTIKNPKFVEAQRMHRWTGNLQPFLSFYERTCSGLIVPRGFIRQAIQLCRENGIKPEITDRRRVLSEIHFRFTRDLRPFQKTGVENVLSRDSGTLSAPTGAGKTIMALNVIARRKQPTLVIVHTKELLFQWRERAIQFLGMTESEIGLIGDGHKTVGDRLTIGIVNSVYKMADTLRDKIGFLIVDECHRTPSRTFTEAVTEFDCRYMLGLSATPYRRDKLTRLIYWHLGDLVHEVDKADLLQTGDILRTEVIIRETNFQTDLDPSKQYSAMLSELTRDPGRNRLIARDVAAAARNGGGVCLCLSDRKAHCEAISELLGRYGIEAPVLTGETGKKERGDIVTRLNEGAVKVVVATGALVGEGFDCKVLQSLFLATPIKFSGRVIQYLGRVLRPAPGKDRATIYDYVDPVGVLQASAKARERIYESC
jgi:superfamily II DNA or RNA helicase